MSRISWRAAVASDGSAPLASLGNPAVQSLSIRQRYFPAIVLPNAVSAAPLADLGNDPILVGELDKGVHFGFPTTGGGNNVRRSPRRKGTDGFYDTLSIFDLLRGQFVPQVPPGQLPSRDGSSDKMRGETPWKAWSFIFVPIEYAKAI